jgi:hypothetical protein
MEYMEVPTSTSDNWAGEIDSDKSRSIVEEMLEDRHTATVHDADPDSGDDRARPGHRRSRAAS